MDRTNSMQFSRLKEGLNKLKAENLRSGDVLLKPGPRVLPPIASSAQLQGDASSSISSLPVDDNPALRDHLVPGDRLHSGIFKPRSVLRAVVKKNRTGLDHAHPLKPLVHRPASKDAALHGSSSSISVSMVPAPPTVAKATGEHASKSKHVKARHCRKATSADPRSISRPDDESINSAESHGNSCQASQVMREKEVDSMLNTLDFLKPLVHRPASKDAALHGSCSSSSVSMVPAPPTVAKASTDEHASKSKHVKARRCRKATSADPRPINRPDDESTNSAESHGNSCQGIQVMREKEVDSMLNTLNFLKPLVHRPATSKDAALHGSSSSSSVSMVPAPPTVAKATGGDASKSKHVKARRCRKATSADPRPINRPDDEITNSAESHGNGCQTSQVMQEMEVDSMLNTLDVLQEITKVKKWIRQENTRVDEERGLLTQENLKSSNAIADRWSSSDHSGSTEGTKTKHRRTQKQQQQHSSLPPLCTSTPSHTSGNHRHFGQFGDKLPYVRKTSSLSLSPLEEETEESDRSATASEEEEEERKVRKSSVRSARRLNNKESESVGQQHIEQQVREAAEQQQARRSRSTIIANPEQALQQALKLLSTQEWEKKVEGLTLVRRLCEQHTGTLLPRLHELCLALTREVKNLRTVVSRAAMLTLTHLYTNLGGRMDAEVAGTAQVLLQKAGEANHFIREDVERALSHMVLSVTPASSVAALVSTGLKHRCAAVRESAALHLWMVSECEDAHSMLSMRKDLTERFIHAICSFALDPAQEVRAHARKTLENLAMHPKLISLVEKCVPKNDQTAIKNIISKYQHSNVR